MAIFGPAAKSWETALTVTHYSDATEIITRQTKIDEPGLNVVFAQIDDHRHTNQLSH